MPEPTLRELLSDGGATKAPWHWIREDHGDEYVCICATKLMAGKKQLIGHEGITDRDAPWTTAEIDADAAFIAKSRNLWPLMLDALAAAEEFRDKVLNEPYPSRAWVAERRSLDAALSALRAAAKEQAK